MWESFITIHPVLGTIWVNHADVTGIANNTEFSIFVKAFTYGLKTGYKQLDFKFTRPPVNQAPYFIGEVPSS